MIYKIWITILFVMLSFSNFGYADTLPELSTQAYVGEATYPPQRDREWVNQCLNLSLDVEKFGFKIIAYKIKWFSGAWSGWYVPGVNDLYKKNNEPLRRTWACFNDHSFKILYTTY